VWQPNVWAEVEDRCRHVLALAERRELPPKEETVICQFCPWSYTCQPSMTAGEDNRPSRRETLRGPAR